MSLLSLCLKHAARCGIQELTVDHWPRAAPGILPKNYAHVRKANRSGSQQPVGTARASLLDREGDEGAHYVSPWLCSPVVIFKWNYSGMSGQFKFRTSERFNFALAMLVWIFRMVCAHSSIYDSPTISFFSQKRLRKLLLTAHKFASRRRHKYSDWTKL